MTFFVEKDDDDHHHDPDDHDSDDHDDDHDDDDDDDYNLKYHIDEKMRDRRKFIVQAVNDLWEINPTRSIAVAARNNSESNSASASGPDPEIGSGSGTGSGSKRDKAKYHEAYVHGWKETEERVCKVVLIGRNLDRDSLEKGFRSCFI